MSNISIVAPKGMTGLACAPFRDPKEVYAVAADWRNASAPVLQWEPGDGWTHTAWQVADFRHQAAEALFKIVMDELEKMGENPQDHLVAVAGIAAKSTPLVPHQVGAIADVLRLYGDRFAGDNPYELAQEWDGEGFHAQDVIAWCEVGCWNAWVAGALASCGVGPANASQACAVLAEGAEDGSFMQDPMYSCCNSDIDADAIIEAAQSL